MKWIKRYSQVLREQEGDVSSALANLWALWYYDRGYVEVGETEKDLQGSYNYLEHRAIEKISQDSPSMYSSSDPRNEGISRKEIAEYVTLEKIGKAEYAKDVFFDIIDNNEEPWSISLLINTGLNPEEICDTDAKFKSFATFVANHLEDLDESIFSRFSSGFMRRLQPYLIRKKLF